MDDRNNATVENRCGWTRASSIRPRTGTRAPMKTQRALLSITAALVAATLGADAPGAEKVSTVLSPQALKEIAQLEAEIDRIQAQSSQRLAERPEGPRITPVEMGLPDSACVVYRAPQRPYRALSESVWGRQAFAIAWPRDVEKVCDRPGPPPAGAPMPVHLGSIDRGRAGATFDQMAQSIAGYEASAEVTPFTSKYDAVLAGKAKFTPQEQAGYDLFRGKALCNTCHRDGGPGEDPLFTHFTASNIGTPANPRLPYYAENRPDALGDVANPPGASFLAGGGGTFLTNGHLLSPPAAGGGGWLHRAPDNQ